MRFTVKSEDPGLYWVCDSPEILIKANSHAEVVESLHEAQRLQSLGYFVACCLSYEAAPAFDEHYRTHHEASFPLLVLLASREVRRETLAKTFPEPKETKHVSHSPRIDEYRYQERYQRLLDWIHAGDLYQANLSFRTDLTGIDNGYELFCQVEREHPTPYAAYLEFDDWQVMSWSPELFLERRGDVLRSEPMKGTAPRGLSFEQDREQEQWLVADIKNRAENVMIVDLMRNDLSKVCEPKSISVNDLFQVKKFRSLFQMVSEVQGTLKPDVSLFDILAATFPAGSITGAPKVRAMEIIHELEDDPRRAYTGSIGMLFPGGDFALNVAIRTVTYQKDTASAELGIGSGVVSHSSSQQEWQECLLKAEFINARTKLTEIFETILWDTEYLWLEEHLERLKRSCTYFQVEYPMYEIMTVLEEIPNDFSGSVSAISQYRIRLSVSADGLVSVRSTALKTKGWGENTVAVVISETVVNENSRFQYHKTNVRRHYDEGYAQALEQSCSEALFFNQSGHLAEGAITNVFVRLGGQWFTPALTCGILPGVWREKAFAELAAKEAIIDLKMLLKSECVVIGNSLRGQTEVDEIWSQGRIVWRRPFIE